jgi:hypothetical protein
MAEKREVIAEKEKELSQQTTMDRIYPKIPRITWNQNGTNPPQGGTQKLPSK